MRKRRQCVQMFKYDVCILTDVQLATFYIKRKATEAMRATK